MHGFVFSSVYLLHGMPNNEFVVSFNYSINTYIVNLYEGCAERNIYIFILFNWSSACLINFGTLLIEVVDNLLDKCLLI